MSSAELEFDSEAAIERLMRFLSVEGITGEEKAIGEEVVSALKAVGVPEDAITFDSANEHIPLPTQTGNLIVKLPGTVSGPRLLFSTHLDTVPLCAGAVPVREKKKIVSQGETALGGDNRTGVAVLVTLAATLIEKQLPHPPLTLLFTVREESGLHGARYLTADDLGKPAMGFNVDGKEPGTITIGAVGAERWEVEIVGKAAHAGAHPEQGISATLVASLALAAVHKEGWFGKVSKDDREGTSNVGSFGGKGTGSAGNATNVVTDYVLIRGEARSHNPRFVREIVKAYKDAFTAAAGEVLDHKGKKAKVKFTSRMDYAAFKLKDDAPVIRHAEAAARRIGLEPEVRISNGGLDANWLVKHGVPTITFGAGQNNIHTVEEFVDLELFLGGCRMALSLATLGDGDDVEEDEDFE
jgi:tripeptide aminopeptidase